MGSENILPYECRYVRVRSYGDTPALLHVLGMILWCKYFVEAQDYTIESNLLHQDNKSKILLEENGRMFLLFFLADILPFFASSIVDLLS